MAMLNNQRVKCNVYSIILNITCYIRENSDQQVDERFISGFMFEHIIQFVSNVVKKIINHPPNHHFYRWYKPLPHEWFIFDLTTLYLKLVDYFFPS